MKKGCEPRSKPSLHSEKENELHCPGVARSSKKLRVAAGLFACENATACRMDYNKNMGKEHIPTDEEPKQGILEKGLRWDRNFNIAVGGVALAGAYLASSPAVAGVLKVVGAFNFLQAGASELGRRHFRKKRLGQAAVQYA